MTLARGAGCLMLLAVTAATAEPPPDELAPLRARLAKARPTLAVDCWIPAACHLGGDFDGDGRADVAALVREVGGQQRKGIAVMTAKKSLALAGAGTPVGAGGADFDWMDAWRVERAGATDGLVVERTESASGLLTLKAGKLRWRQLGD